MEAPTRWRARRLVVTCFIMVSVIIVSSFAYFRWGQTTSSAIPRVTMTPPVIILSPGMKVDYGLLTPNPSSQVESVELNASSSDGLTVELSRTTLSSQQTGPIVVTLSAPSGMRLGNYTLYVEARTDQTRSITEFNVEVVAQLVIIQHEQFQPDDLNVSEGALVTWLNLDTQIGCCDPGYHTVAFLSGTNATSPALARFEIWSYKFDRVGIYDYRCSIHPFMLGTVKVSR